MAGFTMPACANARVFDALRIENDPATARPATSRSDPSPLFGSHFRVGMSDSKNGCETMEMGLNETTASLQLYRTAHSYVASGRPVRSECY